MIPVEQPLLAPDSGQISATWISDEFSPQCVLLIYPDPSQKLIILLLSSMISGKQYNSIGFTSVINETAKFNSALNNHIQKEKPGSPPDAYLAKTCTAVSYQNADNSRDRKSFYLNCFVNQHIGEAPREMDGHDSETPTQKSSVVEFDFHVDISNGNISIDDCMPTCSPCHVSFTAYRA